MSARQTGASGDNQTMDYLRWAVVVVMLAAGVAANMYFADQSLLYRVLGLLVLAAVAIWMALQTSQGVAFSHLVKEARIEVRKVVWPTHQETLQTTLMVAVVVLVTAIILWGLDSLLGWLVSLIIG
jgi:preprotein translocase subunit SecE